MTDTTSSNVAATSISGGVGPAAQRDITIGGDVVGRDKIVSYHGYTVEQIGTRIDQLKTEFQPRSFDGRCPYLGLNAFTENDWSCGKRCICLSCYDEWHMRLKQPGW